MVERGGRGWVMIICRPILKAATRLIACKLRGNILLHGIRCGQSENAFRTEDWPGWARCKVPPDGSEVSNSRKAHPSKLKITLHPLLYTKIPSFRVCPIPFPHPSCVPLDGLWVSIYPVANSDSDKNIVSTEKPFRKATPLVSTRQPSHGWKHIHCRTPASLCLSSSCQSAGYSSRRRSARAGRPRECI